MLKFYAKQRIGLDKSHEIITFKQSEWLENYIVFITQKRTLATNDFERDFNKLPNNAFLGKQ